MSPYVIHNECSRAQVVRGEQHPIQRLLLLTPTRHVVWVACQIAPLRPSMSRRALSACAQFECSRLSKHTYTGKQRLLIRGHLKPPVYTWSARERGEEVQTTREANVSNISRQTVALGTPGIIQSRLCLFSRYKFKFRCLPADIDEARVLDRSTAGWCFPPASSCLCVSL